MSKVRVIAGLVAALAATFVVTACGSSKKSSSAGKSGGTVTVLFGTAPDSLDPQFSFVTQSAEPNWLAYTGLTTYAHANGTAGGQLIPGLATALPTISKDGKTYTMTLRKGLVFSDGRPVKASDFAWTVERAIRIPWGGSGLFLTDKIVGGPAFSKGKAKTISGITTDDATGKITIHLTAPYGAFGNVLAFPALGLVPSGSPFKNEANNPPPGVGPYMLTNIVPNQGYSLVKNPHWAQMSIPGIPAGHVNINAKVSSNVTSNALAVLNNTADVFDWADVVPGSLVSQIQSQASSRYSKKVMNSTYYFFMNTQTKPFSSALARQAVIVGMDRNALNRLSSGTLIPACYYLPPGLLGHPTAPCPYGDPATPNLAKAKQLVKQSGMAGTPVTVWGQMRSPRRQWVDYYTSFLNQLGFKATEKIIADATYFATIGNVKLNAQTGFADWNQDFPNPIDFYFTIEGSAIVPTNNENFGLIKDSKLDSQADALGAVPTSKLGTVSGKWQTLDQYVAQKAYLGVFGYQTFPDFVSNRLNYSAIVFHPVYGFDWSSFELK